MRNYWSCSKFADTIRGTAKPTYGTSKEWKDWKANAKSAHPVRFWIAEEALDEIQDFLRAPAEFLNSIRYYLNNRFVLRTNSLTAHPQDIKPGKWCDVGDRFLPCMFNELVNFVEIEKAWMHVAWDDKARIEFDVPWWRKQWWTRWFVQWRSREAGLAHLDWEMSLKYDDTWMDPSDPEYGKPTAQAIAAKEIKELYLWWTEVYRSRPDPMDVSGWSAFCDRKRDETGDILGALTDETTSPADKAESQTAIDTMHVIEARYAKEDEEMMVRLIRVRNSLWT